MRTNDKALPPPLDRSIQDWAARLHNGQATAEELVTEALARARAVNPYLNAVVEWLDERAITLARAVDARRERREPLPPLAGVPCSLKGTFAIEGALWEAGVVARRGRRAGFTAPAVQRYLNAGLIPIAVTNVPEAGMWMETINPLHGRSANPHDPSRTTGGSSGGEAALIAAGAVPCGLGSDVGGSIRMPANFCGIAGHKPTPGLVPIEGHWPAPHGDARRYTVAGPLALRAADLPVLLEHLAGPTWEELPSTRDVLPRDLRVLVVPECGGIRLATEMRTALLATADRLADLGARVEFHPLPELQHGFAIWSALLSAAGGPSFAEILGDGAEIDPIAELLRWLFGRRRHTLPALILAILDRLGRGRDLGSALARAEELRRSVHGLLADGRTVILTLVYPRIAPRHHRAKLIPFGWIYSGIWNALELPATAVPVGRTPAGIPLGVQIVGAPRGDRLTMAVAAWIEEPVSPV